MLFGNNSINGIGSSTVPMAEGYDSSFGPALALVEGARNDMAMFKAMIQSDFREASILRESSSSYVCESEINALHESVAGGILSKIIEFFKKFIAKIKAIIHNLVARLASIFMDSKKLLTKYKKEIMKKGNKLNKIEVKWRPINDKALLDTVKGAMNLDSMPNILKGISKGTTDYNSDNDTIEKGCAVLGNTTINKYKDCDSESEFVKEIIDDIYDDEDTYEIGDKEVGGYFNIISFIEEYSKGLRTLNNSTRTAERNCNKYIRDAQRDLNNFTGKDNNGQNLTAEEKDTQLKNLQNAYDASQSLQTVVLGLIRVIKEGVAIEYRQNKAALSKMVTANVNKLKESSVYLDAIGEAAEEEVDEVINRAMSKEEISEINAASKNVIDGDVDDCPNSLTKGMGDGSRAEYDLNVDGTIDTEINSKEEAAYFGSLLW